MARQTRATAQTRWIQSQKQRKKKQKASPKDAEMEESLTPGSRQTTCITDLGYCGKGKVVFLFESIGETGIDKFGNELEDEGNGRQQSVLK